MKTDYKVERSDFGEMTGSPEDSSGDVPVEIVTRIAEREGVDPTELAPPLSTVIDTDALQRLVETADDDATVVFEYHGWIVKARGSGDVTLRTPGADD